MNNILNREELLIAEAISAFMLSNHEASKKWYVGITNSIERRLFGEHQVRKNADKYIYRETESRDSSGRIEAYLIHKHQTEGDTGGGNDDSVWVYAYRIEEHAVQQTNEGLEFDDADTITG